MRLIDLDQTVFVPIVDESKGGLPERDGGHHTDAGKTSAGRVHRNAEEAGVGGHMYRLIRTALALAFVAVMAVLMLGALVGVYALAAWVIGG